MLQSNSSFRPKLKRCPWENLFPVNHGMSAMWRMIRMRYTALTRIDWVGLDLRCIPSLGDWRSNSRGCLRHVRSGGDWDCLDEDGVMDRMYGVDCFRRKKLLSKARMIGISQSWRKKGKNKDGESETRKAADTGLCTTWDYFLWYE
jgi:hypothetical protein